MRAMANTNDGSQQPPRKRRVKIARVRPWVQTAFLAVWLGPMGLRIHSVPGCVFHCYACPLASFACPVGVIAQFSSLHLFPLLAVGVIVAVAGLVGSLVCGWACPFGFLQDLIGRIPTPKFRIPHWMSYGRYFVLVGLVILVPYLWSEEHPLFICRVCPAGALEAGVPSMIAQARAGRPVLWMSWYKVAILVGLLGAALFTFRPWCTVLCPLGGALSLFNRFSVFHLRFDASKCTECNLCRSRCSYGVKVERQVNDSRCIRCMECTACGAITPGLALASKDHPRQREG